MPRGTAGETGGGLRRLRLLAGLSARQLAEAADLSHSVIHRAELGQPIAPSSLAALARVLGPDVREAVVVTEPPATAAGSNAVVAARRAQGLSRRQAAKRFGVSDKTLARVEAGQRVHPANAKRIALALGLPIAVIIDLADANGCAA